MSSAAPAPRVSLAQAIENVRLFFQQQCGGLTLVCWHVLSATEDMAAGVYKIRCVEHCYLDQDRRRAHEVWVSPETGEIEHTHRIPTPKLD